MTLVHFVGGTKATLVGYMAKDYMNVHMLKIFSLPATTLFDIRFDVQCPHGMRELLPNMYNITKRVLRKIDISTDVFHFLRPLVPQEQLLSALGRQRIAGNW